MRGTLRFLVGLYRLLASRTIAIVLLLTLAALAFAGSLVSQLSIAGVKWAVAGKGWSVIQRLSMNDLFQARWVAVLATALVVNVALCSLGRLFWPLLTPDQIRGLLHFRQVATTIPIDESYVMIEEVLTARRFRMRHRDRLGTVLFAGRRNGLSLFGSLLFHAALLIGFVGFVVRMQKGLEGELVLFPDETAAISVVAGDTLQVQLGDFGAEYSQGPGADQYLLRQRHSKLLLYHDNRFERAATLSINHPVMAHGIGLFQAEPAQTFVLRIVPPDTVVRVREDEPFELTSVGRLFVGGARLGAIYRHDSIIGQLPVQAQVWRLQSGDTIPNQTAGPGHLPLVSEKFLDTLGESPITLGTQRVTLLNVRQGTRIAYRYDPALPWFYVAGATFLLGILLRGLLPAYELYGSITEEEGETVIRIGGRALGVFTSLRPVVNRIVDRFALDEPF